VHLRCTFNVDSLRGGRPKYFFNQLAVPNIYSLIDSRSRFFFVSSTRGRVLFFTYRTLTLLADCSHQPHTRKFACMHKAPPAPIKATKWP
jgi:hypothetical protein